ncbi:MAG: hypothetical protein ACXACI_04365 [Candidatus Hodarchaeales archaeon]|jgi:5S rRNA maturation endonuclease (ribonuclease M5)
MPYERFDVKNRGIWLRKTTRREKKLELWCDALRNEVEVPSVAIIVEGRNDVRTLNEMQIRAVAASRNPKTIAGKLLEEGIRTIILLPDTDRAGEIHLKNWRSIFQLMGFGIVDRYWKILRSLRISHVEGILAHIRKSDIEYDTEK